MFSEGKESDIFSKWSQVNVLSDENSSHTSTPGALLRNSSLEAPTLPFGICLSLVTSPRFGFKGLQIP